MKKLIVIASTLALFFALSGTALAEQPGGTQVQFKVDNTQISASVPLTLVATVNASTGILSFPAASSYQMVNSSAFAVRVASISCSVESGWTLASSGSDAINATVSPDDGTTTTNLLTASQDCTGSAWNMAADNGTLDLTMAGQIVTPGPKTKTLTTTEATAFTVTYTVEAGANA